jgi:protein ImuB
MFAALHLTIPDTGPNPLALALDRLHEVAADMTPRWERLAPGEVVLDVSGLRRLFGGPDGIAEAARRLAAERGVHVRVATAEAWSVALLRASWPGASLDDVPAGQEAEALASLPIEALGLLPGVGMQVVPADAGPSTTRRLGGARNYRLSAGQGLVQPAPRMAISAAADARTWADVRATLHRWGIRTCGALAALPADDMHARLGAFGVWLQQRARGCDPRPLRTHPPDEVFEETLALEWPIDGLEPLSFVLPRLLDPLCAHLEARDRAAIVVRLALRLTDRQTHLRVIELPAPVRDARVLRTLLLLDLEAHPPHAGIDIISIDVDPAPGRITQHSLLRKALPSDDDRVALLARLTALMGTGRCGAPALVDSHRPGAVAMQPFEPDDVCVPAPAGSGVGVAAAPLATVAAGRARAHAVEPALEGWLDTTGYHLRRLRRPWPIVVSTTPRGARPVALRIGARGWADGAIATASGPWRSSGGWWETRTSETDESASGRPASTVSQTWDRDEWDVALPDGTTYRVFQDRQTQQWWLEGEVD